MEFFILIVGILIGTLPTYFLLQNKLQKKVKDWQDLLETSQRELEKSIKKNEHLEVSQTEDKNERTKQFLSMISKLQDDSANNADTTSEDLANINKQIAVLSDMVDKITSMSTSAKETSNKGMQRINSVVEDLEQLTKSRGDLTTILEKFSEVQEKTVAIRYIGEEAEMLALNAAIEAARAGDAGRGFAVVADSMKLLAKNSQDTTNEILEIVNQSDKIINLIVDNFSDRGDKLNSSISSLVENFSEINSSIEVIQDQANLIDHDATQTTKSMDQVVSNTTTSVESLIRQLSGLVSQLTGKSIVDIDPAKANNEWNSFDEVIDVRREHEWSDELGHIQGVRFSTLQTDFKNDLKTLDPNKTYLFVCRSGGRSTKAAQMAITNGITNVYNLKGGMLEWRKQSL